MYKLKLAFVFFVYFGNYNIIYRYHWSWQHACYINTRAQIKVHVMGLLVHSLMSIISVLHMESPFSAVLNKGSAQTLVTEEK